MSGNMSINADLSFEILWFVFLNIDVSKNKIINKDTYTKKQ